MWSIKYLDIDSSGYVYWTATNDDDFDSGTANCKTNRYGEGVFVELPNGNWTQATGTSQFSVAGKSKAATYAAIRRWHENNGWGYARRLM